MSKEHWVWLSLVLGYGSSSVHRLFSAYGSAEEVYEDCRGGKRPRVALTKAETARLHKVSEAEVAAILTECEQSGIEILPFTDSRYPERLRSLSDPPVLLYVKGRMPDFDTLCAVTVVGPRHCSDYGQKAAFSLSRRLTAAGCLIVSGGAVGADGMAHLGALSIEKPTVAVLGCGINRDYPKGNAPLREKIAACGCLVSEYPPSFPPSKSTYPQRNRILSALSCGTVVVEAGETSGALITAAFAAEQGRDVFVIPGNPSLPQYAGSNALLKDGAKPVLTVSDILEEYYPLFTKTIHLSSATAITCGQNDLNVATEACFGKPKPSAEHPAAVPTAPTVKREIAGLGEAASKILSSDLPTVFTADEAANATDLSGGELLAALTELELMGGLAALPGGQYQRI